MKENNEKHSPLPWVASLKMDGRHQAISILTEGFKMDGNEPYHPLIAHALHGRGNAPREVAEANAALIVRAVNSHAALVDMLKQCKLGFEAVLEQGETPLFQGIAFTLDRIKFTLAGASEEVEG